MHVLNAEGRIFQPACNRVVFNNCREKCRDYGSVRRAAIIGHSRSPASSDCLARGGDNAQRGGFEWPLGCSWSWVSRLHTAFMVRDRRINIRVSRSIGGLHRSFPERPPKRKTSRSVKEPERSRISRLSTV